MTSDTRLLSVDDRVRITGSFSGVVEGAAGSGSHRSSRWQLVVDGFFQGLGFGCALWLVVGIAWRLLNG